MLWLFGVDHEEGCHGECDRTHTDNQVEPAALRVARCMEWALKGSLDQLAAYEIRANFVPLKPDVGLCVYQLEHWGGRLLVSALRSHPLVILGGLLHENPFYVPPTPLVQTS